MRKFSRIDIQRKNLGPGEHPNRGFGIAKGYCRVECRLFNRLVNRLCDNSLLMVAEAAAKPNRHGYGDGAR